ncbi:CRISPR-associated endonuclease/helicase Cas3 [Geodia barretti]|uniref:CRISPR-associated endonuclease/helicase Cas3 n=1 Tax=Geodia barretti TaxID=519541 RepID=A0AA35U2F1_GEOBA|nr:CRISPR-associated endonuclease/helicase Cas3 [Geodia barretti]
MRPGRSLVPSTSIESETGSGKTEAALWRFAHMYEAGLVDGLYFALPTRSAAVQIHERVERFIRNLFPRGVPPVVLAVPGYEPGVDASSVAMQDYEPWWEDRHDDDRPWASKSPKRYLAAQIAVGTVDQAMMCALQVKNAHMRAACLARNLLVVDEVHASDTYMSVVLEALINAHVRAGGYALLMSATSARRRAIAGCITARDLTMISRLAKPKTLPTPPSAYRMAGTTIS